MVPYEAALNLPLFGRIASNLTYGLFSPLVEGRCGKGRKPPLLQNRKSLLHDVVEGAL